MSTIEFEGKHYRADDEGNLSPMLTATRTVYGRPMHLEFPYVRFYPASDRRAVAGFQGADQTYPTLNEALASWEGYNIYDWEVDHMDANPYPSGSAARQAWFDGYGWAADCV